MYGTIDNPEGLDPRGEFFCKYREQWMPQIEGRIQTSIEIAALICYDRIP
jgi:hypothetical protein